MAKQRHTHRRRAAAGWWALALICWLATPAAGQVEAKDTTGGSGADARYGTGPRFNGNLTAWVYSHLRYPEEALARGEEGKVWVRFVVEEDGGVGDIKVVRGVSPELDQAAVELVSAMPDWIPGRRGGEPVSVFYSMPIVFSTKSVERPVADTYDAYMEELRKEEERLKSPAPADSASADIYAQYLRGLYGSSGKNIYKSVYRDTKTRQQSTELMLGVTLPALEMPDADKAAILKAYKDEWAEQIRLVDSLPEETFAEAYASLADRLRDNSVRRELGLRERLGDAKYKRYVEGCILYAGRLVLKNAENPLAGRWELVSRNGERPAFPLHKELREDFHFQSSNGDRGSYRTTHGRFYTEEGDAAARDNVVEYEGRYEYSLHDVVLVLTGEVRMKLADGSVVVEHVKETWRRME